MYQANIESPQSCEDAAPGRIRTKPCRPAPDLALRQTLHLRERGHGQAHQPPHPNRPEPESHAAPAPPSRSSRASVGWNRRWRSCRLAAIRVAANPRHKHVLSQRPGSRSTSARCQGPYAETPDGYQTARRFAEATWGTYQTIRHRPCRSPPKNRHVGSRLLMVTCALQAAAMRVPHTSLHNARDRKSYKPSLQTRTRLIGY